MVSVRTISVLTVSVLVIAYFFYASVPVPSNIEQGDDVFWIFAKRKCIRAMSIVGEFLGLGHTVSLARYLGTTSFLSIADKADYTGVKVDALVFDNVNVRIYEPEHRVDNSPALIWIHGGGWVAGSAEADDVLTAELARQLNIFIVSINYRLAPEFVYPTPFDDCFVATKYFLNHTSEFRVNPSRVAIGGASAGGNLAAAVVLKLRDTQSPIMPSIQVLFVPCLQAFDFRTPSYQLHANNAFLPTSWMINYWLWYSHGSIGHRYPDQFAENFHTSCGAKMSPAAKFVDLNLIPQKYVHPSFVPCAINFGDDQIWNEIKDVYLDPYFAPLMAEDLSRLPEAYIAVAEHDVLRDDGLMYAKRLSDTGVPVELKYYENGFHALTINFNHFNLSKSVLKDLVAFLASHL